MSLPTGQDTIFTGITLQKTSLIPGGRYPAQEVQTNRISIGQVVGSQGKVLDRVLEQYRQRELEQVGGATECTAIVGTVQPFVQEDTPELHATDRVADEGMQTGILCL